MRFLEEHYVAISSKPGLVDATGRSRVSMAVNGMGRLLPRSS